MHEKIVEKLHKEYILHGYITEQQVFSVIEENNIPLFDVEYICDQLLTRGVIIRDDQLSEPSDEDEYDRSQTDYNAIFDQVLEIDSSLSEFIDYVKNIQAPQHREWQNLLPQAQQGNNYARTRVFEMYIRVVVKTALVLSQKYNLELADTIQDGLVGLHTAIDKFEFGKQDLFTTYFPFWVRQIIMREATTRNPTVYFPVHIKEKLFNIYDDVDEHECDKCSDLAPCPQLIKSIADELECNFEEADRLYHYIIPFESTEYLLETDEEVFSDCGECADQLYERTESNLIRRLVREAMKITLNSRENEVITLRYGFGGNESHTLEMVGEKLGVTRERVRQIEAKSLRKLKANRLIKHLLDFNIV